MSESILPLRSIPATISSDARWWKQARRHEPSTLTNSSTVSRWVRPLPSGAEETMLEGYVDESRQPRVAITLVGPDEQLLAVDAVIDTGFDGSLCLPTTLAAQVELHVRGTQLVELADGS